MPLQDIVDDAFGETITPIKTQMKEAATKYAEEQVAAAAEGYEEQIAALTVETQHLREDKVQLQTQLAAAAVENDRLQTALDTCLAGGDPDPEPRLCPSGTDKAGQQIPDGEDETWCDIADPEPETFTRRVYLTQQVSTVAELNSYADELVNGKATVPATNGFSERFPWKSFEAAPTLAQRGLEMADAAGYEYFALRSMAGKHTPTAKMGRTLTEGGVTYPSPFGDTAGNPNTAFLDHLEAHYRILAKVLADSDQSNPILQWTWYAKEWAEIYHGPAVRSAPGYTVDRFIGAHHALIDRAARVQADYPGVIMGLQLSGHGPIGTVRSESQGKNVVLVGELVKHARNVFAPKKAIIHANGWSYRGQWGQQDLAVDATMDAAFVEAENGGFYVGMQAIQPWGQNEPQYTATQVAQAFDQADAAKTDSIEIYTPSLLSANGGAVWKTPTAQWVAAGQ